MAKTIENAKKAQSPQSESLKENSHPCTQTLSLAPTYFQLVKNQQKTLEGRLNDEKRKNFKVGDTIIFSKSPERTEKIAAIILDKYIFKNFDEMANLLNKSELGFATKTKEEMIQTYRTIYTKQDEEKYGVVVFKIKTI